MARDLPKNVHSYTDWQGRERLRFIKNGYRLHYFRHPVGTAEFAHELELCRAGTPPGTRIRPKPKRREATVYFIAALGGPIKIGVSVNPMARLKSLQTAHPKKLRIIFTVPGGRSEEQRLHKLLAAHRTTGEWFARHPAVLEEMRRLRQANLSSNRSSRRMDTSMRRRT